MDMSSESRLPKGRRMADREPPSAEATVWYRVKLLRLWALTPDAGLREAVEVELYCDAAPDRAAEEWARFKALWDFPA
jgi:hypothetical protein